MKKTSLLLLTFLVAAPAFAKTLTIDPAWSNVGFLVSNMGVNTVEGRFKKFTGKIDFDPQAPAQSAVHVSIETASIDTQNEKRDHHLQTADFFDAAKFPQLTFESQSVEQTSSTYRMKGLLTIKGTTKPVEIPFTFTTASANGKTIVHAQGKTEINRHDFGIDYGNSFTVGDKISIQLSVAATE